MPQVGLRLRALHSQYSPTWHSKMPHLQQIVGCLVTNPHRKSSNPETRLVPSLAIRRIDSQQVEKVGGVGLQSSSGSSRTPPPPQLPRLSSDHGSSGHPDPSVPSARWQLALLAGLGSAIRFSGDRSVLRSWRLGQGTANPPWKRDLPSIEAPSMAGGGVGIATLSTFSMVPTLPVGRHGRGRVDKRKEINAKSLQIWHRAGRVPLVWMKRIFLVPLKLRARWAVSLASLGSKLR